jgi:hypothetical protein
MTLSGARLPPGRCRTLLVTTAGACLLWAAPAAPVALAGKRQWSMFEDPRALLGASPAKRESALKEIKALGADTLRVEVKWNEVAPNPNSRSRPSFDATDPAAYPGFSPYDDVIARASALGMRVLVTITGDAPSWATAGGVGSSFRTANWKPSALEYGRFAAAVARRYSGRFVPGLPVVRWFSIWNEPNHKQFLKPQRDAPRLYRSLVDAAIPQIRASGAADASVLVGETAPVGRAGKVMGPKAFIRRWLCLDRRWHATTHGAGCQSFKKIDADGFAHHPYGPADRTPLKRDIVNMLAIRQLGSYLDLAAHAHRLPPKLPIYGTEFGYQSNPPDRSVSTSPSKQAEIINEKEEYSYRYGRLKSYSQYLLRDDPARPGPASLRWSGFQTALRYPNGRRKPAWDAYRCAIVVHRRRRGVYIWGHVRTGSGPRYVQLQKRLRGGYVASGPRIKTTSGGYFGAKRKRPGHFRYRAYAFPGGPLLGTSRTARPIR